MPLIAAGRSTASCLLLGLALAVSPCFEPALAASPAPAGSLGLAAEAPTATNLSASESYTEDTSRNLTDIVVGDVDSPSLTVTLTVSNVAAGTLTTGTSGAVTSTYSAGTGVWTASGAIANLNALLAGVVFVPAANFNASFTIATNVTDGALSVAGNKPMTGIAINDAPTATNVSATETYTEDTPLNLINIVASDVDSPALTATLTLSNVAAGSLTTATSGAVTSTYSAGTGVWTAGGAIANVNALLAGVTFVPAADFNASITMLASVTDGAFTVGGTKLLIGIAINDAPTATNVSATETYTEDSSLNLTDIVASDVDGSSLTATLTLSNVAAGSLTTATSGAVTSTYSPGTGVWTASGAISNVNALLAGVTFVPAANFNANFTISSSVSDGVFPVTGSKPMLGIAINDPPTATNLSAAEIYISGVSLDLVDIVASDIDSPNLTATLTLSNVAAGSLTTATSGPVTSTYSAGTGVWTASGNIANVNALLAGVVFVPASGSSASFTIATNVSDGVFSASGTKPVSSRVLVSLDVIPVNPSVSVGRVIQFAAIGTFADGSVSDLTSVAAWTSSDPGAAKISNASGSQGLATGLSPGTTEVRATFAGVLGTTTLAVTGPSLVSMDVIPSTPTMPVGLALQFSAIGHFSDGSIADLTATSAWSSTSNAVATVSNAAATHGVATSTASGTTTIRATLAGVLGSTLLTVTNATLVAIDVVPASPSIPVGQLLQFSAIGQFSDGSQVDVTSSATWSSNTPAIATVSNAAGSNGLAAGVSPGPATIQATWGAVAAAVTLRVTSTTAVEHLVTRETRFELAGANPAVGAVRMQLSLAHAADARVVCFDVSGRALRILVEGRQAAGTHDITWDGRDALGNTTPAGLYFVRADVAGRSFARRVIRVP